MVTMRKGPWTEQEDLQLVCFVGLFGDRRWDFIAKVSGLNRTGKSCRLRWVNYLHPGLKRGRMTPQEERLILELQSRWGNRWSRIARRLPGRTDNEIKNYWRTHVRKKAQERKRKMANASSSSSSSLTDNSTTEAPTEVAAESIMTHELKTSISGCCSTTTAVGEVMYDEAAVKGYSMDQLWNEIPYVTDMVTFEEFKDEVSCPPMASPIWEYCPYSLWKMDDVDLQAQIN